MISHESALPEAVVRGRARSAVGHPVGSNATQTKDKTLKRVFHNLIFQHLFFLTPNRGAANSRSANCNGVCKQTTMKMKLRHPTGLNQRKHKTTVFTYDVRSSGSDSVAELLVGLKTNSNIKVIMFFSNYVR